MGWRSGSSGRTISSLEAAGNTGRRCPHARQAASAHGMHLQPGGRHRSTGTPALATLATTTQAGEGKRIKKRGGQALSPAPSNHTVMQACRRTHMPSFCPKPSHQRPPATLSCKHARGPTCCPATQLGLAGVSTPNPSSPYLHPPRKRTGQNNHNNNATSHRYHMGGWTWAGPCAWPLLLRAELYHTQTTLDSWRTGHDSRMRKVQEES